VSNGLDRVREVARKDRNARFTALLHHVSYLRLSQAFDALKKDAAPGADGVTWREYDGSRQESLLALHARVRSGKYRAVPSRRVYIPKADGRLRPLGIATVTSYCPFCTLLWGCSGLALVRAGQAWSLDLLA
jgi:RNA-directed DNA polymerase